MGTGELNAGGLPWDGLASHPGGSRNISSHFMLQKPEISTSLMSYLASMQTLPYLLPYTALGTRNCAVNMRSVHFDGESFLHLDGSDLSTLITQHAALAASHCKLETHLVFYFNLLLIVYFLYSIKGTVFHRSLVCFYFVIHFIIIVCRPQH